MKFTEDTPYDPRSPYSASKASSDHLVRAWYGTYGLPVVLTNCSNNYGPYHFPEDSLTEFSDNFFISEIIREKAINRLGDELPYRLNVVIEKIDDSKKLKTIYAAIITESQSQKGIILGKQGSMIKAIGTAARKELEKEFSKKVNLQLWVKANKNWTNDINKLKKFGLGVDF